MARRRKKATGAGPAVQSADPDMSVSFLWSFVIAEDGPDRCRLFSSNRVSHGRNWKVRLTNGPTFVEPVSYPMDLKMLDGIRRRVESAQAGG